MLRHALILPVLLLVALNHEGYGQACAMCYSNAAASGQALIQGLKQGILLLALPPLTICIAIGISAYRKRDNSGS